MFGWAELSGYNLGGRVSVVSWLGDIAETGAAVIVNSIGSRASFRNAIAQSILKAAGPEIQAEVRRYVLIQPGSVVVTHAGHMAGTRYLFHTVVTRGKTKYRADSDLIVRATTRCVLLADLLDQPSIALPAFGTGLGRARPEEVVEQMINALADIFPRCKNLDKVVFATTNKRTVALFNFRVLAVQALIRREQELKSALADFPPSLYGLVGSLLQQLQNARHAGTNSQALLQQAEGIISLGSDLRQRLPEQTGRGPEAIQLIINTGNSIVQNVTQIVGAVHAPVLSGTFDGPVVVGGAQEDSQ